jgi:hypothetical protein
MVVLEITLFSCNLLEHGLGEAVSSAQPVQDEILVLFPPSVASWSNTAMAYLVYRSQKSSTAESEKGIWNALDATGIRGMRRMKHVRDVASDSFTPRR